MGRYLILKTAAGEQRIVLTAPVYNVGRGEECEIRVEEAGVSRKHARVLVGGANVSVEDLGSSNGTYVDGRRVRGEEYLTAGGSVRFGTVEGRYFDDEAPAPAGDQRNGKPAGAGAKVEGALSLQGFLEGDMSLDDGLRSLSSSFGGMTQRRGLNWRIKLVALVAGTILLAVAAIGSVLLVQFRSTWRGRAILELRSFAAENLAGLVTGRHDLLSGHSIDGDVRVHDAAVLASDGTVLWTPGGSLEREGTPWSGWPAQRPSAREATVLPPRQGSSRPRLVLPVAVEGRLLGWIVAEWDRAAATESSLMLGVALAVGAFLVLLSYLVLEGATAWVTRPVRRLANELSSMRRDDAPGFEVPGGVPELQELRDAVLVAIARGHGPAGVGAGTRPSGPAPVAHGMPVPMMLLDDNFQVLDGNLEAMRLLGLESGPGMVHLGRKLAGSYFGSSLLKLMKQCRAGEIVRDTLELQHGGETSTVQVLVRRPAQPAGYSLALVILPTAGSP